MRQEHEQKRRSKEVWNSIAGSGNYQQFEMIKAWGTWWGLAGEEKKRRGEGWGLENATFRNSDSIPHGVLLEGLWVGEANLRVRRNIVLATFLVVSKLYHITCSSNKILYISLISKLDQSRAASWGWSGKLNFLAWPFSHSSPRPFCQLLGQLHRTSRLLRTRF